MSAPTSYVAHDGTVRRWLYPWPEERPHGFACYDCGLPSLWTRSFFVSTAGNVSSATIQKYVAAQRGL